MKTKKLKKEIFFLDDTMSKLSKFNLVPQIERFRVQENDEVIPLEMVLDYNDVYVNVCPICHCLYYLKKIDLDASKNVIIDIPCKIEVVNCNKLIIKAKINYTYFFIHNLSFLAEVENNLTFCLNNNFYVIYHVFYTDDDFVLLTHGIFLYALGIIKWNVNPKNVIVFDKKKNCVFYFNYKYCSLSIDLNKYFYGKF